MGQAQDVHLLLELGVIAVLNGLHSDGVGGFDVLDAVVEEEDVGWRSVEALRGVVVDGVLGLGEVERVGPGVMIEVLNPGVLGSEAGLHGVGHVGEDADTNAGALQVACPVEHRWVEGAPVVGVGGDEGGELGGRQGDAGVGGYGVPVGFGFEVSAIVGVTMCPVLVVEGGLA